MEKLAGAFVDAQVDLNPHQVEAALFAFQSPLSKGALLADEVGLGKTIEAGLVIAQKWAERKRRILIITPANLRKQWHQELQEKFFLPCTILETRSYNEAVRKGNHHPFEPGHSVVICSYQFARSKAVDLRATRWDLVTIDEAHHLRNVYKPSNVIANTLKQALEHAPKLLLTATPLQNSLLELFGLVSFIDEHAFGDLQSFREQFAYLNDRAIFESLKARLRPICKRTLRRQVTAYVSYTKRHPLVQPFTPEASEDQLYDLVSNYLRRDNLQALPSSQRSLMTLVLRKLLASSSFAIAGALETISRRLQARLNPEPNEDELADELDAEYEALSVTAEEWPEEPSSDRSLSATDRAAIEQELADLEQFRQLAVSITHNAKGAALLIALERAFVEAERLGAPRKAIIFTESRRTQEYLLRLLAATQFADGVLLFNGSNNDEQSRRIYSDWFQRHKGTDRVTGSRSADMRSALVDYFREQGQIMIATEAGAEGINLQFCSLVVNYDLPWNPQRIEQRIGRCHRYGQKHDVVVVNFLNQTNAADQRVFQLLSEKFYLFEGVFGASDEVLGAIESGIDFEKRIADIYQRCRTVDEIQTSFDQLQLELSAQVNAAMTRTRQQLLENFDEEVQEKLRVSLDSSRAYLNQYERQLMQLTEFELGAHAEFMDNGSAFRLKSVPPSVSMNDAPLGLYELPRRSGEAHLYRLGHPLAEWILHQAKSRELPPAEIVFDYTGHPSPIAAVKPYAGQTGDLLLCQLSVEALDQAEDYLLFAAMTRNGQMLEEDAARRLFSLRASSVKPVNHNGFALPRLHEAIASQQDAVLRRVSARNAEFLEQEAAKLDNWADDLKVALEREIKELDRQIKEARRAATAALTLEEKLAGQRQIRALESQRNTKRRALFDAQDDIDRRRENLIAEIEDKLHQKTEIQRLFYILWSVI